MKSKALTSSMTQSKLISKMHRRLIIRFGRNMANNQKTERKRHMHMLKEALEKEIHG